ncbi:MAG: thermostable hemolysin [Chromatiales bacterium]|jgi:hypothetical protein
MQHAPQSPRSPKACPSEGLWIELIGPGNDARRQIEEFIRAVYARAYGARITRFMPHLLALRSGSDAVLAVLGLRHAAGARLFLEAYLDEPVERRIGAAAGVPVRRSGVCELGNLASAHAGSLRRLIVALTGLLSDAGAEWVVFTGGPRVSNAFARLGVELIVLGAADRERLSASDGDWGSYYADGPVVLAARVEQGRAALREGLERDAAVSLSWALWERALATGACRLPGARRWNTDAPSRAGFGS